MADLPQSKSPGSGTLLLILIQVASRALTFIGNQVLLRFLSPSLLGIAVQLELVSVTSLYFARESLRVALQRQPPSPPDAEQKQGGRGNATQTVVNLSYLAILLGLVISTAFGWSYLYSAPSAVLGSPYFDIAFRIYAAATILELLAEPAFVVIQQKALYADRARAETLAAMARCFSACIVAVIGHKRHMAPSVLPFAVGQAAYAGVLLALYIVPVLRLSRGEKFSIAPRKLDADAITTGINNRTYYAQRFHKAILGLATTMYMQSVFKLFLTQGDALILSFLSSLADQGAFALASNYGGLLARLVFQPVEESSRNMFGRLLSSSSSSASSTQRQPTDTKSNTAAEHAKIVQALKYLTNTLHFYNILSLPLVSIAPHILPLVVRHIMGARWYTPSTASLLGVYCYYIPLMAVNGILDAFVTSVATPAQLRTQSIWMLLFTASYGIVVWAMLTKFQLGAAGLVGANMVNMGLRIVWSIVFVRQWVREHDRVDSDKGLWKPMVRDSLPAGSSVIVAALLTLGLRLQATGRTDGGLELDRQFLGLLTAGIVLLGSTILFAERDFWLQMLQSIVPQRLAAKIPGLNKRSSTKPQPSNTTGNPNTST
ncbi:Oligosaccharide translocation protein rft1 [Exophiala xenobiotica]|nr:Oligosaccharide translocation protein rft1 [Exophiala xenobiotica]KAK5331248.1 Oligosaccharide translocation protein rft1 [Exophiala xenobiotica]